MFFMAQRKLFLLLPLLLLVACGSTSSVSENTSSSISESSSIVSKTFEEKLTSVSGKLKMSGTLSFKFYNGETGEPTESDPVTSQVNVLFSDVGYEISYNGDFDENFTETLFKSSDNTVELRYIGLQNTLVTERPKTNEGEEYDFTPYTNPFPLLTGEMLTVSDNESSATLDLANHLDTALDFVGRLTYYNFPSLSAVSIASDENTVTSVHIETPVLNETLRSGVYTFDLNVEATGEDVVGPVEPTPAIPDEKQAILQAALEDLLDQNYEASLEIPAYGDVYYYTLYKNEKGIFGRDTTSPRYDVGYYADEEGNLYSLAYDFDLSTLAKTAESEYTLEDVLPPWTMISSLLFTPSEDGKSFTSSSVLDASLIGTISFLLTNQVAYDLLMAETITFNLNDENHISSVAFSGEYLDDSIVMTFTNYGSCTMPFEFSELPTVE